VSPAARNSKRPAAFAGSEPARRAAAAVLGVLGGLKTPLEASQGIGVSVNRYYQLETRALAAMVRALEPLPRGRRRTPELEIERLRREKTRLEREASRYQSLLRASQKALGLAPTAGKGADSKGTPGPGKRARRPRVRAKALITSLTTSAPSSEAVLPTAGVAS
jgi:hypothetical protein